MRTEVRDRVDELPKRLRAAYPQLILRVRNTNHLEYETTPSIREVDPGWDELLDEGYDPNGSPLGPVYWRIIQRAEEKIYCSTFVVSRDQIVTAWGPQGLAYCDPVTGLAVARIETVVPESDDAS